MGAGTDVGACAGCCASVGAGVGAGVVGVGVGHWQAKTTLQRFGFSRWGQIIRYTYVRKYFTWTETLRYCVRII